LRDCNIDTQKWTEPPLLDMAVLMVPLALLEMELFVRYKVRSCASAPMACSDQLNPTLAAGSLELWVILTAMGDN